MDYGDLFGGLNALDVVRAVYNPDGSLVGLYVDAAKLPVLFSDPLVWDDLRFPAQGINPIGAASDPTIDTTTFPGTMLFSGTQENVIAGVAQMPHGWAVGDSIHPHIHWAKTSAAVGDAVWEFRYTIADIGEVFGAYSAWEPCTNPVPHNDTAEKQVIAAFSFIDMSTFKESAIVLWQIRRNPAAVADNYAADARFYEFDIHYRKNKLGTVTEIPV